MTNIFNLVAAEANTTSGVAKIVTESYNTFIGIVNVVLPILIAFVLAIGIFYGVQLGIKYAKAEDDDGKKKAKDSLINTVVGCLIAIVFIAIIEIVLNSGLIEDLFTSLSTISE